MTTHGTNIASLQSSNTTNVANISSNTSAITTLQNVVWVVGRTGTVNPTGIVEPVELDGATVSRVTLHNMEFIENHDLGLGDLIQIERAGGVIPKFNRVIQHSQHNLKIKQRHAEEAWGRNSGF